MIFSKFVAIFLFFVLLVPLTLNTIAVLYEHENSIVLCENTNEEEQEESESSREEIEDIQAFLINSLDSSVIFLVFRAQALIVTQKIHGNEQDVLTPPPKFV